MTTATANKTQSQAYRLMTYNIGGGRKNPQAQRQLIVQVIREAAPDILVIQEVVQVLDVQGTWRGDMDDIGQAMGADVARCFLPTLTMREHMHPSNKYMVNALFKDHQDWQQGNELISRWPFHALGNPEQTGKPRHIPLNQSYAYEGSRDTEPRAAIITRIGRPPHYPIVVGLHLSTLVGERGRNIVAGKPEQARQMRENETRRVIDLLRENVLSENQAVFLLGDFNATLNEASLQYILDEGGFIAATPKQGAVSTHPKVDNAIDHVFLFPPDKIVGFTSHIVDSEIAHQASDHLPVVVDVELA